MAWDLQTNYPNVKYQDKNGKPSGATIKSGGCCPTSVGNVLRNYVGISAATTKTVCTLATSSRARYNGGTNLGVLLAACKEKWGGFTYKKVTADSEMKSHVANGGMAVAHTTGSYALFSMSGHFVAVTAVSGNTVTVMDPYYYTGKWKSNSVRKANIKTTSTTGMVKTSYTAVAKAFDYYYLITKNSVKSTTATKTDWTKPQSKNSTYAKGKKYTTTTSLNLRAGAGTDQKILKTLAKGTAVMWYGYYTVRNSTTWLYVQVGNMSGFVSKKYLK